MDANDRPASGKRCKYCGAVLSVGALDATARVARHVYTDQRQEVQDETVRRLAEALKKQASA